MPILAKASGANYKPAPSGTHAAVCVDIIDLGEMEVTYSGKTKRQHKVSIVWQIDALRDDGKPYQIWKRYTLSLHEKSSLRRDLESWRGKAFNQQELEGFDLEVLLSVACLLNVIHAAKGGDTYANIASIMRLPKGMAAPTPRDYVRVCDRPPAQGEANRPPDFDDPPGYDGQYGGITDDDVPF